MDWVDRFSFLCGFVAMAGVGIAAMALGYGGMSFSGPWVSKLFLCVVAESLLMWWIGPAPAMVAMVLLQALSKRRRRLDAWFDRIFHSIIFATAIGLALLLVRFIRPAVA